MDFFDRLFSSAVLAAAAAFWRLSALALRNDPSCSTFSKAGPKTVVRVGNDSAKAPLGWYIVVKERVAILAVDSILGEYLELLADSYQKSSLLLRCNTTWAKLVKPIPRCSYTGSNILNEFGELRSNLVEENLAETMA